MQKICIVIPCYNEYKRLSISDFSIFCNTSTSVYFCFVNDGSKDETLKLLYDLQIEYKEKINVLNLSGNQGKAEAVRVGILHALKWKNFDYVGYFDADLSTPLTEINLLMHNICQKSSYQIAFGSRIRRMGTNIKRSSRRHYFGRVFSTFASIILKLPVYDTQCGAKLIRASIASQIFNFPFITKWLFDIEIFARLIQLYGYNNIEDIMIEVPLEKWVEKGDSKIKITHLLKVPFDLLKIYCKYNCEKANKKFRSDP